MKYPFMKKDNYVFAYGSDSENKMKKQMRTKILLSPLCLAVAVPAYIAGLGTVKAAALAIMFLLIVWAVPEVRLKQYCNELRISFKMAIPDFLDIVALLLDAGQPLWYSVETASEMNDTELCKRINSVFHEAGTMDEGRNAELLLDSLAAELKTPEVSSAIAAIVQNSRKGEKELSSILRTQSGIQRRVRKDAAEELGNKASNLLMIPTVMVFAAILAMLIAPAIMQLNIL